MLTIENLVLILIVLLVLPWASYTTAKLGTIGFLRGREFFNQRQEAGNGSREKEVERP